MDHLTWFIVEWAQRRRDMTEFGARQFAKWAAPKYDAGRNIAELFEDYKQEAWNL